MCFIKIISNNFIQNSTTFAYLDPQFVSLPLGHGTDQPHGPGVLINVELYLFSPVLSYHLRQFVAKGAVSTFVRIVCFHLMFGEGIYEFNVR